MLWLASCSPSTTSPQGNLKVVSTTSILGDVVNSVGGALIEHTVLVPPGLDPHSFEPSPQYLPPPTKQTQFLGQTFHSDLAAQLVANTGIQLVLIYTESLSDEDGPAADYIDMMRYDVQAIVGALK